MSAVVKTPLLAVRPMGAEDLDDVMRIELTEYPFPWTRGIFADCLTVGYHCVVGELDGAFAGYAVMSQGANEAHVLNVCVGREFQRRGLGRYLLECLIEHAAGRGMETVFLEVRPSNAVALGLYERLGFNEIATRKGYYPSTHGREDAIILALSLEARRCPP
jgi:ribosomal-protein-alanine N-acetyltransferase